MTGPAIFRFDPSAVEVALGRFEKGPRYIFEIKSLKSYTRMKKDASGQPTNDAVFGIYFGITCQQPASHAGQKQIYNGMLHTDGVQSFTKSFLMAALGFNPRDKASEEAFNKQYGGDDFSLDFQTGSVGTGWQKIKGRLVSLDADITMGTNNQEQQQFSNPQPVTA